MNFINLLSILESNNNLSDELFKKYSEYLNVILKDTEIEDLLKLIEKLVGECQSSNIFDGYYIGYRIPQISKEFDLLRITEKSVINIELKSGASEESIKKHERYPFLKTTILSSINQLTQQLCQRKDIALPRKSKTKSLLELNTKVLVSPMLVNSMV